MLENLKVIEFSFFTNIQKETIGDSLKKYLKIFNKENIYEYLLLIIFEVIKNAYNSNLKKAFIIKNSININSLEDFKKINEIFYNLDNVNKEKLKEVIKSEGYNIKVYFGLQNNEFIIRVENNIKTIDFEKQEILNVLNFIKSYNYFDEILKNEKETSLRYEILFIIMLLKKIGLDENYIKFIYEENITKVILNIPFTKLKIYNNEVIIDEILAEIKNIPQFPQHIVQALYILNNPNSNFDDISEIIKKDVALIADILKLVNSAIYSLPKKVASIEDAVRIVGIKGLKNLIIAYSTHKIFVNKYNINIIKKIMQHSTEVAVYASEIAKKFNLDSILDYVYVCGMLHDFGKIIINSINPIMIEKTEKICKTRGLDLWAIESLTQGYNHSFIGAKLAEKWNFPDYLKDSIILHHTPWLAKEHNKTIVYTVYLANILTHYRNREIDFEDINKDVLNFFNIQNKDMLDILISELYKIYTEFFEKDKILI